jgi:phosphoglycolate phosphatase
MLQTDFTKTAIKAGVYDLLIFDLDGTLIDSVGDIADALNATLAPLGVGPYDDAQVATFVGSGVRELIRRALPPALQDRGDEIARDYRARYSQWPVKRTSLYLGVKPTLEKLAMEKAVATNKPGALSRRILDELGVAQEFSAILGEDDVGRTKPDPLIVDIVRGKSGATKRRTLYIGDSLVDADTADAAGVDLALVTYGYADREKIRARSAKFHFDRFADLLQLLDERR